MTGAIARLEGRLEPSPSRDEVLLAQVAHGDEAAFRALFVRHQQTVFRTAFAVLLDHAEARDVVQEVFVRLHREARRWQPRAPLAAWLYRVTLNQSLSVRRKLGGFFRSRSASERQATAERQLSLQQTVADLRSAMSQLSPRQRAMLTLHLDQDLSPSEIAPLLGLTANATRVALHRALEQLRAHAKASGVELPLEEPTTSHETENEADSRSNLERES